MERDYFLNAEQALEMGLVDKVLTSRAEQEKVLAPLKGETEEKKDETKVNGNGGNSGNDEGSPHATPGPAPKESSS